MSRLPALILRAAALTLPAAAQVPEARPGWRVIDTALPHDALLPRRRAAIAPEGMALTTEAGPAEAADARRATIPGSRAPKVLRNDDAVRALGFQVSAMIEASIRFHAPRTQGAAAPGWKAPAAMFAPYADKGGVGPAALAGEFDGTFEAIAARATED